MKTISSTEIGSLNFIEKICVFKEYHEKSKIQNRHQGRNNLQSSLFNLAAFLMKTIAIIFYFNEHLKKSKKKESNQLKS